MRLYVTKNLKCILIVHQDDHLYCALRLKSRKTSIKYFYSHPIRGLIWPINYNDNYFSDGDMLNTFRTLEDNVCSLHSLFYKSK